MEVFNENRPKIKRFLSLLCAMTMILNFSTTSFTAEQKENGSLAGTPQALSNDETGIMPLSSTSGYASKTLNAGDKTITVKCNSSGTGGMGITIEVGYT